MIEEVINSIISAENKADDIRDKARIKARQIIQKAEEEADEIRKAEIKSVANDILLANEEAAKMVETQNKVIIAKAEKSALTMREAHFKKMIRAQELVVGRFFK